MTVFSTDKHCRPKSRSSVRSEWRSHTKLLHSSGTTELTAVMRTTVQHWLSASTMDIASLCAQNRTTVCDTVYTQLMMCVQLLDYHQNYMVRGFRTCWVTKIIFAHYLGCWFIQHLVLPYKPGWSQTENYHDCIKCLFLLITANV